MLAPKPASSYVSKHPDARGYIDYDEQENQTWRQLYRRQIQLVENRACPEFIEGLARLEMSEEKIPQLPEINTKLSAMTGWQVERVPALIGFGKFFKLLAQRKFPAATFIRRPSDLDYIKEPDIFHELFGHCPLLAHQDYADFSQHYGELGLKANPQQRAMLARLYWFTVEFGLVQTSQGLRIYGGGILSSKQETVYSLNSPEPKRQKLDVVTAFRTHYRIDQLQANYFVIDSLRDLQQLCQLELPQLIEQAHQLGMLPSAQQANEIAAC